MTDKELITEYQRMIVALAQEAQQLKTDMHLIRSDAQRETSKYRKCGLLAKSNAKSKQRERILKILFKNKKSLKEMFGTTNVEKLSQMEDYIFTLH